MLRKKIKSVLNRLGVLPILLYYKKIIFPSAHDKDQASLLPRYKNFYNKFLAKGDLCFDIGAHMGSRVDVFLECGAKVIALEPYSQCYEYMKFKYKNKNAIVINKGVGPNAEDKEMYVSDDPTTNSFSSNWVEKVSAQRFKGRKWKKKITMKMTSLDELISTYGVPTFCKIDVEGFEYEVFKGLSHPINMISFEYTVPEEAEVIDLCINKLSSISPEYKYNYSIGESMIFQLKTFVSLDEFRKIIKEKTFNESACGDIYATVTNFQPTEN